MIDFVHPATTHDETIVTLHSLLDRDVYRGGAIVVGPVRRGRGRKVRVERRIVPVSDVEEKRMEVLEREIWRIAVENLDYPEQHAWAALAGARVNTQGWRRARAMLQNDRTKELRRRFLLTCVQRNRNAQLRLKALGEIADLGDAEAFDDAIDIVGTWSREDKRAGTKTLLQALVDKRIGRRDQAQAWVWRLASYTRELHEEYAVQRWPETKRLLGLLVNSSGRAHGRNARRLVHAARKQDRRLAVALLAAAVSHTPEGEEVLRGARMRMARKPSAVARELLRNFPKGGKRRRKRSKRKRQGRERRRAREGAAEGSAEAEQRGEAARAKPRTVRGRRAAQSGEVDLAGAEGDAVAAGGDDDAGSHGRRRRRRRLSRRPRRPLGRAGRRARASGQHRLRLGLDPRSRWRLRASAAMSGVEAGRRSHAALLRRDFARPPVGAEERDRRVAQLGGNSSGAMVRLRPTPITAQPSWGRASIRTPASLRPSTRTSLGHLTPHSMPGPQLLGRLADGQRHRQRQQQVALVERAQEGRVEQRLAGRRGPGPPLAPASRGLLGGGDDGPVRRPGRGQLAGAGVGRVGAREVPVRRPEAIGASALVAIGAQKRPAAAHARRRRAGRRAGRRRRGARLRRRPRGRPRAAASLVTGPIETMRAPAGKRSPSASVRLRDGRGGGEGDVVGRLRRPRPPRRRAASRTVS